MMIIIDKPFIAYKPLSYITIKCINFQIAFFSIPSLVSPTKSVLLDLAIHIDAKQQQQQQQKKIRSSKIGFLFQIVFITSEAAAAGICCCCCCHNF
jgi:hypothetical protein